MTVIICVDSKGGMLFDRKRQAKNKHLREFLLDMAEKDSAKITMSPYTYKMFREDNRDSIIYVEQNFEFTEDYLFLEEKIEIPWEKVDRLILCCWNRDYPADTYFRLPVGVICECVKEETVPKTDPPITVEIYSIKTQNWYRKIKEENL